jgi:hypothetical protein
VVLAELMRMKTTLGNVNTIKLLSSCDENIPDYITCGRKVYSEI